MNASKTLIAAIAAATIVGTVGFVSAQTTDSNAPATQTTGPTAAAGTSDMQQAPTTAPADMSSPPYVAPESSTPAAPNEAVAPSASPSSDSTAPSTDARMGAEPAPKADRN